MSLTPDLHFFTCLTNWVSAM